MEYAVCFKELNHYVYEEHSSACQAIRSCCHQLTKLAMCCSKFDKTTFFCCIWNTKLCHFLRLYCTSPSFPTSGQFAKQFLDNHMQVHTECSHYENWDTKQIQRTREAKAKKGNRTNDHVKCERERDTTYDKEDTRKRRRKSWLALHTRLEYWVVCQTKEARL